MLRIFPLLQVPDRFLKGQWGFLSWNLGVCLHNLFSHKKRFDLVFTISTPVADHLTGLFLKKWLKVPWVAFFSDPWVDNPFVVNPYCHLHAWLQKKVLERADTLIFVTQELRDVVLGKYPSSYFDKSFTIPHSYCSYFSSLLPKRSSADSDKVIFRYVGTITRASTPEPLMAGIALAKEKKKNIESQFQFEFIGQSFIDLQKLRRKYNIGKEILEVPRVSYLESLSYMKGADVLVSLTVGSKKNIFLPSKSIEYIGARRPLFGIIPKVGIAADLVRRSRGFLADSSDSEEIADCILEIVEEKRKNRLEEHVPTEDFVRRFSAERVAGEYAAVFEKAIAQSEIIG
jgi:glycosyltransferase involved in cell wall biosynthesis